MTRLNRYSAALALAVLSASLSVPAMAKRTPVRAENVRADIEALNGAIDRADRNDTISEREAAALRGDVNGLRDQFQRFNADGLSPREIGTLQSRTNRIRARLRVEKVDHDNHRM